jgi:ATP-dependent DNA ligase
LEIRYDRQSPREGMAEQPASSELAQVIHKFRSMGLEEEATSLETSVRRRELRALIGEAIKAYIDVSEPIPQRLAELIEQFVKRLDERGTESGSA